MSLDIVWSLAIFLLLFYIVLVWDICIDFIIIIYDFI